MQKYIVGGITKLPCIFVYEKVLNAFLEIFLVRSVEFQKCTGSQKTLHVWKNVISLRYWILKDLSILIVGLYLKLKASTKIMLLLLSCLFDWSLDKPDLGFSPFYYLQKKLAVVGKKSALIFWIPTWPKTSCRILAQFGLNLGSTLLKQPYIDPRKAQNM